MQTMPLQSISEFTEKVTIFSQYVKEADTPQQGLNQFVAEGYANIIKRDDNDRAVYENGEAVVDVTRTNANIRGFRFLIGEGPHNFPLRFWIGLNVTSATCRFDPDGVKIADLVFLFHHAFLIHNQNGDLTLAAALILAIMAAHRKAGVNEVPTRDVETWYNIINGAFGNLFDDDDGEEEEEDAEEDPADVIAAH